MYTPKKKTTINEMTESYFRRRKANQSRIVQLNNIRRIDS